MAVSIGSITAANATFSITAAGLFTSPQSILQFKQDEAWDSEAVENAEVVKGVDGILAYGWLPTMPKLNIHLMANSPSNAIFDQIFQAEQEARDKILLQGLISVPGISTQYTLLNGLLFSFTHTPSAKKTLDGRNFVMILDDISYSPL